MNNEVPEPDNNPYQAPQAAVADVDADTGALLYVVAPFKFWVLGIVTMGLYLVYWFYKHWSLLNRKHKAYWPVPRAIFAVFFAHALFNEIDGVLQRARIAHRWAPRMWATTYVIAAIASGIVGRASDKMLPPVTAQLFLFALMVPMLWSTYEAQRAANAAEGDPGGSSNSNITAANMVWIVLGGLWWSMILLGMYLLTVGGGAE